MLLTPLQATRLSQPQGAQRIDWSNPITRGLVAAVNAAVGPSGNGLTVASGSISIGAISFGKAFTGTGRLVGPTVNTLSDFTALVLLKQIASVPGQPRVAVSAGGFWMGHASGGSPAVSNSSADTVAGAFSAGAPAALVAVRRASELTGWLNGVKGSTSTNTPSSTGVLTIKDYSAGGYAFPEGISFVAWWNRALSDAEIASISQNPWQVFQADDLDLEPYYVAVGGPISVDYAPGLELDAAQPLAALLSTGFAVASEVDAALSPAASLRPAYSVAPEVDRAIAPAASLRASYGVAVELDAALPLQAAGVNTYGAAQELNNAYALSTQLRTSYGVATEVDRALALSTVVGYAYGTAVESDAALAVSARLVAQYGMAAELDQAFALLIAGEAPAVPPQRRLIAVPGGSTAFYVPPLEHDFAALDF